MKKSMSSLLIVQGLYYLITGLWPLIHLNSFVLVTGPKTDVWLVKTVGLLVLCVGLALLKASSIRFPSAPVNLLAVSSALAFTFIDFYYPLKDVISKVYMADGMVQLIFIICWIVVFVRRPVIQQRF